MMLFIIIPMVGIILGSFLAAIGLVVDQQTIETGGMVSMSTFWHLLYKVDQRNNSQPMTIFTMHLMASNLRLDETGGRGVFLAAGRHPVRPLPPQLRPRQLVAGRRDLPMAWSQHKRHNVIVNNKMCLFLQTTSY